MRKFKYVLLRLTSIQLKFNKVRTDVTIDNERRTGRNKYKMQKLFVFYIF